ncbi:hypothetical protein HHX47_DHR1000772 [Lentinula edodes]|nr:hypothetical protein HHX47_DHR1000772 [Lentinula edodes]
MSSSSTSAMDWEAQYAAGVFEANTAALLRSGKSRKSRIGSLALDSDDEDQDITMASASASASARARPASTAPILDTRQDDESPISQLTRHWINERHAPDILPAQEDLLASLLDHIRRQIEKFARFIMTDTTIQTRITTAERAHASRHAHLTDRHFHTSVLQSLPETQSHLDDTPIFMPPMITKPDDSRAVFVHALRDCPPIRFHEDLTLEMKRGHISLMPFSFIEQLLVRGDVELL